MPGPKRGFTTPHTCATVDSMAQNQPSERDRKACKKLQEKVSDFQVTFNDNVYLSIGLEAKHDIYNSFDPNEPYDIHLEPPSHDHPPLVKIKQKENPLVYTTDFYFTNKLPSNIVVRPQGKIITVPMPIRQKQQTPHSLQQTHFSQAKYAFTHGCFTHHKHLCLT